MTDIELPGQQGAADKFVARYGHLFRYAVAWRKYIAWDGKRWCAESGDVIVREIWQQHLKDTLKWIANNAKGDDFEDALDGVKEMANVNYENAMLTLCQARTTFDFRALDADPYVLNCNNGIIDLRTGALRDHVPDEYCTRLAPVEFDAAAQCPQWLAYLDWAMQGDAELVAYLQRFFGLCLTGDAEHELAHFFYGDGGNGKTTIVKTIEALLGDYARRAPSKILMQSKHEGHPTEKALMCGRRLVVFAETNENQTIDEQMLKLVASKDIVSARRMREDFWDFAPTHKAVLLTNNKPRVRGQDRGIWRRIVLVPWLASVSEDDKDPHFGDRFIPELPGILNWALAGLQQVLAGGMRAPDALKEATNAYRQAEDSVPRWIEAQCVVSADVSAPAGPLFAAYQRWAEEFGETFLTRDAWGKRLDAQGHPAGKGAKGVRLREGIKLRGYSGR